MKYLEFNQPKIGMFQNKMHIKSSKQNQVENFLLKKK